MKRMRNSNLSRESDTNIEIKLPELFTYAQTELILYYALHVLSRFLGQIFVFITQNTAQLLSWCTTKGKIQMKMEPLYFWLCTVWVPKSVTQIDSLPCYLIVSFSCNSNTSLVYNGYFQSNNRFLPQL